MRLGTTLYIAFDRERISIRNLKSGAEFSDEAMIAVSGNKVVAVGRKALEAEAVLRSEGKDVSVIRPLDHERMPFANFETAVTLFQYAIMQVSQRLFFAPVVVLHCLTQFATPLTAVESKALVELGEAVGARKVVLSNESERYTAQQLQDASLRDRLGF